MTIKHHPDGASLMSFAAGAMPEALAAVTSAHVSVCHGCRERVRQMEAVGGVLMDDIDAEPADEHALLKAVSGFENAQGDETVLSALDDQATRYAPRDATRVDAASEVPPALQSMVGTSLDDVKWSRLGPGVKQLRLPTSGDGDLRLLYIEPGRAMPEHGHGGSELTMVLRGAYHDETGHYKAGDVADLDEGDEHQPVVDADGPCICIIASDAKMKYKSVVGRILQPIIGM